MLIYKQSYERQTRTTNTKKEGYHEWFLQNELRTYERTKRHYELSDLKADGNPRPRAGTSLLFRGALTFVRIKFTFTETEAFRCYLEQLVIFDKIDALLETEIGEWRQLDDTVAAA